MSKILWLGDAGCHTGFAKVTHSIGERLVADYGHEVHVIAVNYDGDPWPTNLNLYPPKTKVGSDTFGQSRYIELLAKVEPDVVVILNDPNIVLDLILRNKHDPQLILARYRPIISYVPIDAHNQPPRWAEGLHKLTQVIAMSEHGAKELTIEAPDGPGVQEGLKRPPVIYHGVDVDRFYPVSRKRPLTLPSGRVIRTKTEAKQAFGWGKDDFIVLRVDKNSGRKDYPATWKALVPFMLRHKNVKVHFHCQGTGLAQGLDMEALFSRSPETHGRFYFPDPKTYDTFTGWPEETLVGLMNAADVFITTSRGEGFGLTIAEAMACGLPVIAQNVSAIPEVVGPGGILIEPERETTVPSGKDQWLADVPAFSAALERLYESAGARRDLGQRGREHIEKLASWDRAAQQFDLQIKDVIAAGEKAAAEKAVELISQGEPIDGQPD